MTVTEFEEKRLLVTRHNGFRCPIPGIVGPSPDKQTFLDKVVVTAQIVAGVSMREPSDNFPEANVTPAKEGSTERIWISLYEKIKDVPSPEEQRKIAESVFEIEA